MAMYTLLVEIPSAQVDSYERYIEKVLLPYYFDTNENDETELLLGAVDDLVAQEKLPRGSGIEDLEVYTEGEVRILSDGSSNYRSLTLLEWFDAYMVEGCMSKKELLEAGVSFAAILTSAFEFLSDGSLHVLQSEDVKEYLALRMRDYFALCNEDRCFGVVRCHF